MDLKLNPLRINKERRSVRSVDGTHLNDYRCLYEQAPDGSIGPRDCVNDACSGVVDFRLGEFDSHIKCEYDDDDEEANPKIDTVSSKSSCARHKQGRKPMVIAGQWENQLLPEATEHESGVKKEVIIGDEKAYPCPECDVCFSAASYLQAHINQRHCDERPFPCKHCQQRFKRADHMRRHIEKVHHGNRWHHCANCTKTFDCRSDLELHATLHADIKPLSTEAYPCAQCQMCFSNATSLHRHFGKHHGGTRPHSCVQCHKSFTQKNTLKRHLETVHRPDRTHLHPCPYCESAFDFRSRLESHLRMHMGVMPFLCEECGRKFGQASNLRVHIRVHRQQKNFQCEQCAARFVTSSDLTKHRRKHTGEKPYKCAECGKQFSQSTGRTSHERNVHDKYRD